MDLTENVKAKDENLAQNAADFSFDHKIFFKKNTIHSFDAILPCNNKATKNCVKDAEARRSI